MSYRSSSASEHDGGDLEEFRSSLAEIQNRISLLTRQCEAITRRNGNAQQHRAPKHLPSGVPEALAHFAQSLNAYFARRFEQIASTSERTDGSRSLNGQYLAATKIAETEKELSRISASNTRGRLDQLVESQFTEINKTLANDTQKIAEQTARNQTRPETSFEQIGEQLASRIEGIVQELRSDFNSKIAGLTNRLEQQFSSSGGIRATEAAEREASLLAQIDKIVAQLSDKYDREAQSLARNLEDQLKRSFSSVSLAQHAPSELFINEFVDKIDDRLAAIAEQFGAELANIQKNTNTIRADVDRDIARRANRKRADSVDAEALVKRLQEHFDRCVSEISAYNTGDAGKNEQLIATMGEQIRGGVATLVDASRREAMALIKELDERLERRFSASLKHQDRVNENLAANFGQTFKEHAASLDEKIAVLAEKGRTATESLARVLGEQIEGDVLKLAENTRAELARAIALVGALETKIAALADKAYEDSAVLAQTLQNSSQELREAIRGEAERTTGLSRSLEAKVAALSAQTQAEGASLAKVLNQEIEGQALRLLESGRAESAKTKALVDSLEQKIAALVRTAYAHSEVSAKTLHQTIETHARELADNARTQAVKTTSFLQSLETQIASFDKHSRTEAAKTTALLEQKITTLVEKNKADLESVAHILGQKIEHHVQGLAEYTRVEAARTAALVDSLERTVTLLAEKGKADSELLARGLGQEIAGHVLRLTENTRAGTAKTLDLIGLLEDRVATLAEQSRAESQSLAQTLSQEIERRALALTESTRADAATTRALFESKIAALSGKVQADTELLANALSRQIESSVRQVAENSQANAAKTATLIGSLEDKIATTVERGTAETAALTQKVAQQIEGHALQLGEKIRTESAGTNALLEGKIAALAESSKADAESLGRQLGLKINAHVQELAETTCAEAAKTAAHLELLHETIREAAEKDRADSESLRQNLGQQIEAHSLELAQNTRAELGKTNALIGEKIAVLAESGKAASESLALTLGQQIETRARELTENTRAEAIRTTDLFEHKITALAEKSQADTEFFAKTLSQQIETRAFELAENTKAEAAKTATLLEIKMTALAERSEAEAASRAKALSQKIESHILDLTEKARTGTDKITASIGSLEEKTAAFAEHNRAALEMQASAMSAQLKVQLAEMGETNQVQTAELRKLLDTGMEEIEHSIATLSEASRAEFQSRFKAFDEQFRRRLDELSQQSVAGTEALAESLRHRNDLGVTALIEGSKAEAVALESLLRTLTEQIYRKLGAFTDSFRSESENGHKKIDALRNSIDHQLNVLMESSQENFSRLSDLTGGLVERLDAAEAQLLHIEAVAVHAGEAQSLRQLHSNGESHAPTNGHVSTRISDPAEIVAAQGFEHSAMRTHNAKLNGGAIAAKTNGGELTPTNGAGAPLNGRLDATSDGLDTDDPCDPPIVVPDKVSIIEESSKQKPRIWNALRWFGFNRAKY